MITGLVGYIIFWLWMQRLPVAHFELQSQLKSFDMLKVILFSASYLLGLPFLYPGWFVLALGSPVFAMTLAIFLVDLFAQIVILSLLRRRGGKGSSGRALGGGVGPAPTVE